MPKTLTGAWYAEQGELRLEAADTGRKKRLAKYKDGGKNYETVCQVCGALPTVHPTDLCGPCCFGEAETLGGNW